MADSIVSDAEAAERTQAAVELEQKRAEAPMEMAPGIFVGDLGEVELYFRLAREAGQLNDVDEWLKLQLRQEKHE